MLCLGDYCGTGGISRSVNPSFVHLVRNTPQFTLLCGAYCVSAYLSTIPFYVVGEATAAAVQEIQVRFKGNGFSCALIRGEQSGTGEQLGRFITNHYHGHGAGKLLYLTGDKNRETLPKILQDGGLDLHPLQVYKTQGSSSFAAELQAALDSLPNSMRSKAALSNVCTDTV